MTYELALKLKEAGFPKCPCGGAHIVDSFYPTLSELIEACKEKKGTYFMLLHNNEDNFWRAGLHIRNDGPMVKWSDLGNGETPEEAVANLWLALNKK